MDMNGHKLPILLLGFGCVTLFVTVIFLAVWANREACKFGLQVEQKCQNLTHLLKHQLTQAQEVFLETKAQAAICNQTVVTLTDSLEMEKAQSHKQQELVQELQEEIRKLKQMLQNTSAELKRLREENEASGGESGSTSSQNTASPLLVSVLLSLGALQA